MINFGYGYGYSATEPNYEGLFKERFQLKRELKGSLVISNPEGISGHLKP